MTTAIRQHRAGSGAAIAYNVALSGEILPVRAQRVRNGDARSPVSRKRRTAFDHRPVRRTIAVIWPTNCHEVVSPRRCLPPESG